MMGKMKSYDQARASILSLSDIHFFKSCVVQSTIVGQRKSFNFHLSDIPFFKDCGAQGKTVGPSKIFNNHL